MQAGLSPVLLMIMLIAAGYILHKTGLLKDAHTDALPVILLHIAYPALIVGSVTSLDIGSLASESLIVVGGTVVITLLLFLLGRAVLSRYRDRSRKPLILFSMAVGNIAYVALPIIRTVFGDAGVYYTMLHSSAQDLIIWTLYYSCFVGGGTFQDMKLTKLISPSFVALLIAILLAVLGLKPAGVIKDFLTMLGGLTVPLALLYIGGVLASLSAADWKPDRDTILLSVGKVLIIPLAVFGVMQFIPVAPQIRLLLAVCFAAPVPVMSTIWAKQYGYDHRFSVTALLYSTVLFLLGAGGFIAFYGKGPILGG